MLVIWVGHIYCICRSYLLHAHTDILFVFLDRVGVIEAHVGHAPKLLSDAKVEADRLGVADVQVPARKKKRKKRKKTASHILIMLGLKWVFSLKKLALRAHWNTFYSKRTYCTVREHIL